MSEIVITRLIEATPETVYSYLTDPIKWSRWQGSSADIEARHGGLFSMVMPNGLNARGHFVELLPSRKIVFTWGWPGHPTLPPGSSTVTIDLEQDGSATRLTLTHSDLPDDEIEIHTMGWEHYVPRLAGVAEGEDVGADPGPG